MSGILETDRKRISLLLELARGIMTRGNVAGFIRLHREAFDSVTPAETMEVLDRLIAEGFSVPGVKANVAKILNVFFTALDKYNWEKPAKGHFLDYMMLENREAEKRMGRLRELSKRFFNGKGEDREKLTGAMKEVVADLKQYELHYTRKENILFPYIEKTFSYPACLRIMWSLHDDFRHTVRDLMQLFSGPDADPARLNKLLGKLFFTILPVIFREEHIVYPVAYSAIPLEVWDEMLKMGCETEWCYIQPPVFKQERNTVTAFEHGLADLGTGMLSVPQIMAIFNTLPVDVTFVDENDEVRYFSETRHKIFGRSKAVIGRKVQNCHPHESVDTVNRILAAFREGRKDHADFWITKHGRFIHIRYFAMRDANGLYLGTVEVTQDVTEIRELEGERRLLNWKD